jgi:hypothetical protein
VAGATVRVEQHQPAACGPEYRVAVPGDYQSLELVPCYLLKSELSVHPEGVCAFLAYMVAGLPPPQE